MTSKESLRWTLLIVAVIAMAGAVFYLSMKNRPEIAITINPTPAIEQQ